jgi:RNA polymerase sigma-70 factor (ECF subfamily)
MDKTQKTDFELVNDVLNGDKESYVTLIDRYQTFILSIINKYVHDREDVKDILQELVVKIYFSLPKYNIKYKFKNWVYKIVLNYVIDFIRKKDTNCVFFDITEQQMFVDQDNNPEEDLVIKEKLQKVLQCIKKLKQKYKEVILLKYIEGLDINQIAEVLNTTVANVKVRLHRAMKMIKKEINI